MLTVIGCLALIVIVLSGIGALIGGRHRPGDITFGAYAILGLVPLMAVGLVANFLTPLTHEWALATAAFGLAAFALKRRLIWSSLGARPILMLSMLCTLLIAFSIGAVITPPAHDTGLYHLQAIAWLEQSTKVFGLANLHLRFGVNSTWFTAAALLDLPSVGRQTVFLLNPALLLVALATMLQPAIEWRPSAGPQRMSNVFAALAALVLLVNAKLLSFHSIGASPSYDLPSALLTILAFWAFIKAHEMESVGATSAVAAQSVLVLVASILAVTVKLSAAPILLLLPAALRPLWRDGRFPFAQLLRDPLVVCVGMLGALWLASGIASSGCAAFPAPVTCLSALPWSVPGERVRYMADIVAGWARMPGDHFAEALHGWAWLKSWPFTVLAHRAFFAGTGATLAILALLVAAIALRGRRAGIAPAAAIRSPSVAFAVAYAGATGCIGIVFWFATAPDPRFGMGFLMATPTLLVAWAAWRWLPDQEAVHRAWAGNAIAGLVFLFGAVFLAIFGVSALAAARAWPMIPVPVVHDELLGPRFHANVPVGTDQCWDAPLPCAPDFRSPSLRDGHILLWRSIEAG
jgi:hypothetical protein